MNAPYVIVGTSGRLSAGLCGWAIGKGHWASALAALGLTVVIFFLESMYHNEPRT